MPQLDIREIILAQKLSGGGGGQSGGSVKAEGTEMMEMEDEVTVMEQ